MKHLFSADVSLGRNSLGHLSIQEGRSMYMKYPLPYVCESLSLSVSQSPSQAGACSPPQVQCAHTHMCTTLPRHLRLIQELLTEPSTHIHLPQAHLPSQNIPSAGTYHWRKEGRPPLLLPLRLSVLENSFAPPPHPPPTHTMAVLSLSLDPPELHKLRSLYSKPVQPICRMGLESQTLDLFPYSASLTGIYMVNQMGCFPVFCEKTPKTPFIFLPLKAFWFITQKEFSRWHQPVQGSRVHMASRGQMG